MRDIARHRVELYINDNTTPNFCRYTHSITAYQPKNTCTNRGENDTFACQNRDNMKDIRCRSNETLYHRRLSAMPPGRLFTVCMRVVRTTLCNCVRVSSLSLAGAAWTDDDAMPHCRLARVCSMRHDCNRRRSNFIAQHKQVTAATGRR